MISIMKKDNLVKGGYKINKLFNLVASFAILGKQEVL